VSQRRAKGTQSPPIESALRQLVNCMTRRHADAERRDGPMTARLADENDDESPVEIVNRHGHVVAVMSQDTFRTLEREPEARRES